MRLACFAPEIYNTEVILTRDLPGRQALYL